MTSSTSGAMSGRIAHFDELECVPLVAESGVSTEALDLIYARTLFPVIVLDGDQTNAAGTAPIVGAAGMTMTFAISPPGQGPSLHAHVETYETFTVLRGTFEFSWGDEGEHGATLGQFDVISFPPGINRAFRNVGDDEGMLQAVITGGPQARWDVSLVPEVAQKLADLGALEQLEAKGMTLESGRWLHRDRQR